MTILRRNNFLHLIPQAICGRNVRATCLGLSGRDQHRAKLQSKPVPTNGCSACMVYALGGDVAIDPTTACRTA